MILMIDNYDSFTYNLVQALAELGAEVDVVRNDKTTVPEIEARLDDIDGIIISPGPGTPADAGISVELVQELAGKVPILGVCLGHQAVGAAFGARIVHAPDLMHGKVSGIHHDGQGVFAGLPNPFVATRYHSLTIQPATLPDEFEVTAKSPDGVIQGIRHREYPLEGVQFHPESILTVHGNDLLANYLHGIGVETTAGRPLEIVGY